MKKALIILFVILCSVIVSADVDLNIGASKYSSEPLKIKFDDKPNTIIFNNSNNIGCGADGRFFMKFNVNSDLLNAKDIKISYKEFAVPGSSIELPGTYYRRNMQTGIFENVSGRLFSTFDYYFFSDPIFKEGDYVIKTLNYDGQQRTKDYYIHCPKFVHTCKDFKPSVSCYNTNDKKMVIEFSNVNIREDEKFSLNELFIHTKGTNEKINIMENTLAEDAKLVKIGDDKYRIVSSLVYGDPRIGVNVLKYVYFQSRVCYFDMYPDAFASPKCGGLLDVSSSDLDKEVETSELTGAAVASETKTSNNYWIYGLVLLVVIVIVVLLVRKKSNKTAQS